MPELPYIEVSADQYPLSAATTLEVQTAINKGIIQRVEALEKRCADLDARITVLELLQKPSAAWVKTDAK